MRNYKKFYLKFDEGHQKWTLRGQIMANRKVVDDDRLIRLETNDLETALENAKTYLDEQGFDSVKIALPNGMKLKVKKDADETGTETEEDL